MEEKQHLSLLIDLRQEMGTGEAGLNSSDIQLVSTETQGIQPEGDSRRQGGLESAGIEDGPVCLQLEEPGSGMISKKSRKDKRKKGLHAGPSNPSP